MRYILIILFFLNIASFAFADTASWYDRASCIKESGQCTMANGKELQDDEFTCASWDHSFGTRLKITSKDNGKTIIVKVTDKGPARRLYRQGRTIDLSKAAFRQLASLEQGVIEISIEVL